MPFSIRLFCRFPVHCFARYDANKGFWRTRYKSIEAIVAFALMMTLPSSSFGEIDVNGWRELDLLPQVGYMAGVMDTAKNIREMSKRIAGSRGISITDYWIQHPESGFFGSAACPAVTRLPLDQKLAILKKYIDQNPELWDGPMAFMVAGAFGQVCRE